jgi:hypothetical protein
MITATDRAEIQAILDRYRRFEECLLRGLRLSHFALKLELEFEYIWERAADDRWRVAVEPSTVVLALEPVEQALISLRVPAGILEEPSRADWGLTEVAVVRVEEPSDVSAWATSSRHRHKLVVAWERDQQIDVVFRRLHVDERLGESARESE